MELFAVRRLTDANYFSSTWRTRRVDEQRHIGSDRIDCKQHLETIVSTNTLYPIQLQLTSVAIINNAHSLGPAQRRCLLRPHRPTLSLPPGGVFQNWSCQSTSTTNSYIEIEYYEEFKESWRSG